VSAPQPPKPRRRIAGEAKPGEAAGAPEPTPSKPKLPKLPKRPKAEPAVTTTVDLPAAPPRPESARVPRAKLSTTFVGLLALAIVAVAFGAFGVWHGVNQWRESSMVESRDAATDAAASAVETIYSYRYNKLDEHLRAAQATMTPKFGKTVPSATRVLKKLAPLRRTQVKAVVRNAAAKECGDACSPRKATVLIFFDMASAYADSDKPTVVSPRIDVFMVERNGEWLVDNIKWL
jgi:hypothetical protein